MTQVCNKDSFGFWVFLIWFGIMQSFRSPALHISASKPFVPQRLLWVNCTPYNTIYNVSYLNVKLGHSHTKAWTWRVQRVKLQVGWSVFLLHSPIFMSTVSSNNTTLNCTCEETNRFPRLQTPSHHCARQERRPTITGQIWHTRDTLYAGGGEHFWAWQLFCWFNFKTWHFSQFRDHLHQTTGSIFERERQMFTTHP